MWKNLSIKKKLILAFMMIGLFSAITGIFGIGAIYSTNKNTNDIYSGHFVPVTYLFNIQKNFLKMNDTFDLMLYERDMFQVDKRVKEINDLKQKNEALMKEFGKTGVSAKLYKTLKADMASADGVTEQMSVKLQDADYNGAVNIAADFHSRVNIIDKDIQKLIDESLALAAQGLQDSQRTFFMAFWAMIGISAFCMALAVITGAFLSGKIGLPIIRLSEAADKLAAGDINVNVETDLKDEIGRLVKAFGRMADNIKAYAGSAQDIAEGDLNVEIIPQSEEDVLGISMRSVVATLRALTNESGNMTAAALNGDLAHRGNETTISHSKRICWR